VLVYADISDVIGHVDDRDTTTLNGTITTDINAAAAAGANDADDDDDVDELSSSDVSSYTDAKLNSNLTSSTDDNIASCRSAWPTCIIMHSEQEKQTQS